MGGYATYHLLKFLVSLLSCCANISTIEQYERGDSQYVNMLSV